MMLTMKIVLQKSWIKRLKSFTLRFVIFTRDIWKFCQIGLVPAGRPILAKFPNITRTINPKLYSQSHDYLYKYYFIGWGAPWLERLQIAHRKFKNLLNYIGNIKIARQISQLRDTNFPDWGNPNQKLSKEFKEL